MHRKANNNNSNNGGELFRKDSKIKWMATAAKKAARKGSLVAKLKGYHARGTNRSSKSETKPKD